MSGMYGDQWYLYEAFNPGIASENEARYEEDEGYDMPSVVLYPILDEVMIEGEES